MIVAFDFLGQRTRISYYFLEIASFSDMDCDVERANAVGDELLHHQPLDGRHHQRHIQRRPQLHIHAHRQLAFR